jgi:pimeloyl-ACP methyl ester carboxylesterase
MEKINLKNRKGQKIVGVLEKPEGKILGTCIVQHGWGGNKEKPTIQAIKDAFLKAGFQTFNFDSTNTFGESDGDFEKSTLGLHWEDLEDVVKWVQKQEWFIAPLALTGHSKGGYAVAKYAEEHPSEVNYLVPVAPVVSGKLSWEAYEEKNPGGLEKWKSQKVIEQTNRDGQIRRQHWFQMEERLNHDLLENVNKLTMPTLLIVGSKDTSSLPKHVRMLYDKIPSNKKEMKIIEGASHSFYEPNEIQSCKHIIKDWLSLQK